MFRALIPEFMVHALVAVGKDHASAFRVAVGATQICPLGLFRVVVEGALETVEQAIVDMQTHCGQTCLYLFQRDLHQLIADLQVDCGAGVRLDNARHICQQHCCGCSLIGVRVGVRQSECPGFSLSRVGFHPYLAILTNALK